MLSTASLRSAELGSPHPLVRHRSRYIINREKPSKEDVEGLKSLRNPVSHHLAVVWAATVTSSYESRSVLQATSNVPSSAVLHQHKPHSPTGSSHPLSKLLAVFQKGFYHSTATTFTTCRLVSVVHHVSPVRLRFIIISVVPG